MEVCTERPVTVSLPFAEYFVHVVAAKVPGDEIG